MTSNRTAGKKNQPLQTTSAQQLGGSSAEISAQNRKELPFFDGIEWTTLFKPYSKGLTWYTSSQRPALHSIEAVGFSMLAAKD